MLELFLNIVNSGIALYVWIQCKNDLFGFFFLHTMNKRVNSELVRTHTVKWGDDTAQHMISTAKLLGAFNGNNIADILDHANSFLLAHAIGTNRTDISVSNIEATLAEFYFIAHPRHHFAELLYILFILF